MSSRVVYAAPRLVRAPDAPDQAPTSEWWVVGALLVVLAFFAAIGAWCWFVCNGHVQECYADYWNRVVVAHCYS